jgi:hypothetical protein
MANLKVGVTRPNFVPKTSSRKSRPVLLLHSDSDSVTPTEQFGRDVVPGSRPTRIYSRRQSISGLPSRTREFAPCWSTGSISIAKSVTKVRRVRKPGLRRSVKALPSCETLAATSSFGPSTASVTASFYACLLRSGHSAIERQRPPQRVPG